MGKEVKKVPILKIGVKNLNDRIYTMKVVESMVEMFEKKRKEIGAFFGQSGHPDTFEFDINLKNAIIDTTKIEIENDVLYGNVNGLDIESKREEIDLAIKGLKDGTLILSPRSAGVTAEDGTVSINKLFAFDVIQKDESSYKNII